MKLELPDTRHKRQTILRDVYEDNVNMASRQAAAAPRRSLRQAPPRRSLWFVRVVLAFAGFLLVLGGFQVYQEIQAKQRSLETPTERIAQAYGSPDDPGLRPQTADGSTGEMPVANLFGLQVRTIVIDPGHGGKDPGAIGPGGLAEKDVTLDVARRLRRRLERDYGYQILMTREDDRKITPHQRVAYANEQAADLFISIHVNALPVDTLTTVETYYFSPRGSDRVERLAALENEASGYSMAEWREAIENIETTLKFQESKQLATSIQRTHYRNMQRENGEVNDWGVRSGPFIVLLGVEVPAVLAEISVISNRAEEAKLNTAEYREQLAMSLEAGIAAYLNPPADPREPTEDASEDASEKDDD